MTKRKDDYDEIGYWSELKLDILREYERPYATILSKHNFEFYYIDGFAGPGEQISKATQEQVFGSPLRALETKPPFRSHFLIDLRKGRLDRLRKAVTEKFGKRTDIDYFEGDCSPILLEHILPLVTRGSNRRALCVLDPYGLHLDWRVIQRAGKLGTIDMFLNFPTMAMNRQALWRNAAKVKPENAAAMTRFWGDESWREIAYKESPQGDFFKTPDRSKVSNEVVAEAFQKRLTEVAGFAHVPRPLAMKGHTGSVLYYLFFASQQPVAEKIASHIFSKYRDRQSTRTTA